VICLFPDIESAEKAGEELEKHLPPINNRPEFFGEQLIVDENETVTGFMPLLLPNALNISIDSLPKLIDSFGGFCYPAHIDKQTNSVLSVFGYLPDTPAFPALEVHNPTQFFKDNSNEHYSKKHFIVTSSDAHQLADISEREHFIDLDEPTFASLRKALHF